MNYNAIDIANNMISIVLLEVRKGKETKYQDGMRKAEDWFNDYRYKHELDQSTIVETMRLYYKWLEMSEVI